MCAFQKNAFKVSENGGQNQEASISKNPHEIFSELPDKSSPWDCHLIAQS
jgi:hypothetical protein